MLTPEQQSLFSSTLEQLGPSFTQTYGQLLQPQGQEDIQQIFQQTYLNPAMQAYQQQIVPAIQQRFADMNASSSSALNRALAQSAQDLSTSLGTQYGNLYQQEQARQMQGQLAALSGLQGLLGQQTFMPVIEQRPGILPGLLQGLSGIAGGYFMR